MPEQTDQALIRSTLRGEVQAYGELVERYQRSVYNVCYRMMRERQGAEDMSQEAFVRAFERLNSFDLERPFGPWIRKVATNVCLNRLTRGGPPNVPLDDEFDTPLSARWGDPEGEQQRAERVEAVRQAVWALPPHYRAVIELRHFQGLTYAEIGEVLGLPLSDVRSHLYRARRMLAEILSEGMR